MFFTPRSQSAQRMFLGITHAALVLIVCLASVLGIPAQQARAASVVYVVPGGAGTRTGEDWANAKDLQDALTSTTSGELWVKAGTYKPTTGTDRNATFQLKNDVAIYGGFAGTETLPTERDATANPTYLSGNVGSTSSFYDNSFHVVTTSNTNTTAVLDGVIVTQGNSDRYGGGIYNVSGSPTLHNITITQNQANSGAGMYNLNSTITLDSIKSQSNYCGSGGGMYNQNSIVTLINADINSNNCTSGSGIVNVGSNVRIDKSEIIGNYTPGYDGFGGIGHNGIANYDSNLILTESTVSGNHTDYNSATFDYGTDATGGGIYNSGHIEISDSYIEGNYVYRDGGGIENVGSINITNSTISANFSGDGASAIYNTGSLTLTNVLMEYNTAYEWATIANHGTITATNVTMANNENNSTVIYNNSYTSYGIGTLVMRNSVVWDNGAGQIEGLPASIDIQYSDIQGGYSGTGNMNIDPQFISIDRPRELDDYRLRDVSPVINRGLNSFVPAGTTTDLDGNSRIVSGTVDMGAYENQQQCLPTSVLYVNGAVSGGLGDGSDWTNAYPTLIQALSSANACSNIEQIWVARGTYTPTTSRDRNAAFYLKNGVAIYGGFDGAESALSERDPSVNVTTLSGELGNPGSFDDNTTYVVNGSDTDATAILDGVTIKRGSVSGVYNRNGSPTLTNVVISNNRGTGYGGGIWNVLSNPTLTNVIISGNSAAFGGGIANSNSSPVLRNVVISGNSATTLGGAIYNDGGSSSLTNVTMSGNTAPTKGGAVFSRPNTQVSIRNSIIWGNSTKAIVGDSNDIQYSDIQGGYPGTGNLNTDPLFVTPQAAGLSTAGNYRLRERSPLINQGNNSAVPSTLTIDRDGKPRIVGGTVDMGAYESKMLPSTTTLQSSLNPARYGESSTFTARVSGDSATPTGSITFMDGTTVLQTVALVNGQASISRAKLSVGAHTLKAVYSGSGSYTSSTSAVLVQTIRKAATTTTLTSSSNPAASGQPVILKARVVAATGGTPTGTVTFTEGTTVLGTATLDSTGIAKLTLSTLGAGQHTVVANYAGTATFAANASAPLKQTITP